MNNKTYCFIFSLLGAMGTMGLNSSQAQAAPDYWVPANQVTQHPTLPRTFKAKLTISNDGSAASTNSTGRLIVHAYTTDVGGRSLWKTYTFLWTVPGISGGGTWVSPEELVTCHDTLATDFESAGRADLNDDIVETHEYNNLKTDTHDGCPGAVPPGGGGGGN